MAPAVLELRQVEKSYSQGGEMVAALPAWLTARAPLADALSYE